MKAEKPIRFIRLGGAKRLTRACSCGNIQEPLNPSVYFVPGA